MFISTAVWGVIDYFYYRSYLDVQGTDLARLPETVKMLRSYCLHENPEDCMLLDWPPASGIEIVHAGKPIDHEKEWLRQVVSKKAVAY